MDMFSVECQRVGNANPVMYQTYETALVGGESGERVVDTEPLCGRVSLKNPTYLYDQDETQRLNGASINAFRVDFTNMVSIMP